MKLAILAYSSNTGLGYQTRDLAKNLNAQKILIVDISHLNNMPVDHSWAPDARITQWPTPEDCEWLTDDIDILFLCETPLDYRLIETAHRKNVKIVTAANYEFLDYIRQPETPPPSLFAMPTRWNIENVEQLDIAPVEHWPVPVDRSRFRFYLRKQTKIFVHIIGRPAVHDRNGTIAFLQAAQTLGDRYRYKIFLQPPADPRAQQFFQPIQERLEQLDGLLDIETDCPDPENMYRSGDVLVLPRKYGGLCLPAQEALSTGMPTIMTDISPNGDLLPKEWLCDATYKHKFHDHQHTRYAHVNVDVYEPDINSLVTTMKQFDDPSYTQSASIIADTIADTLSWEKQKPLYTEKLEALCKSPVLSPSQDPGC